MINMKKNTYNLAILLLLTILVSLVLGGILWSSYFTPKSGVGFWGFGQDINLDSPEYSSAGFVIQDPRKVYVSQDLKIDETVNYLDEVVLGVFPVVKDSDKISRADYFVGEEVLSGLVISSDGWVLLNVLGRENVAKVISQKKDAYILLSKKDKKIYQIEEVVEALDQDLMFIKIKNSNNFPVRNLVNISSLRSGQSIMAYNFSGQVSVNFLKSIDSDNKIKFSDDFQNVISLNNTLSVDFKSNFLFDLNGDLLALIDNNLNILPVHDFRSRIYSFLKNKKVESFKFGVYYVDLREIAGENLPAYGAWINNNNLPALVKDGLADLAGIEVGDVIVKINNYEIDNFSNLNDVLNNFVVGERLIVSVLRSGELIDFKIDLK